MVPAGDEVIFAHTVIWPAPLGKSPRSEEGTKNVKFFDDNPWMRNHLLLAIALANATPPFRSAMYPIANPPVADYGDYTGNCTWNVGWRSRIMKRRGPTFEKVGKTKGRTTNAD